MPVTKKTVKTTEKVEQSNNKSVQQNSFASQIAIPDIAVELQKCKTPEDFNNLFEVYNQLTLKVSEEIDQLEFRLDEITHCSTEIYTAKNKLFGDVNNVEQLLQDGDEDGDKEVKEEVDEEIKEVEEVKPEVKKGKKVAAKAKTIEKEKVEEVVPEKKSDKKTAKKPPVKKPEEVEKVEKK